jgi:melibiose permease/lactose/raffinose/galactose permease
VDQKQRESFGAFARICANVGMYIVMVGWQPITAALGNTPGAWFKVAAVISAVYLAFLCFPIFGVKEDLGRFKQEKGTTLKQMWDALTKNDQLMWTTLSMALFMVGYCTTTGFATYYMQYLFGDINMYAVLAGVCGVAQLGALMVFPLFSKKHDQKAALYRRDHPGRGGLRGVLLRGALHNNDRRRRRDYLRGSGLHPAADADVPGRHHRVRPVEAAQAQRIHHLLHPAAYQQDRRRAVHGGHQPVAYPLRDKDRRFGHGRGGHRRRGKMTIKGFMFVLPLMFIVAGYFIYLKKYKIDSGFYKQILSDLEERGELRTDSEDK